MLTVRRAAPSVVVVALILAACGGTSATTVPSTTTTAVGPTTTRASTSTTASTTSTTVAAVGIEIVGDDAFVTQTQAALDLLATDVPEIYDEVLDHIDAIESVTAGSGMDVFTKTFRVGDVTAYAPGYGPEDQVLWLAGTIVHDACHSRLYTDGEEYVGRDAELTCLEDQLAALLVLSGFEFEDYIQFLIDGVDDPANEYWNDPDRHW